MLVELSVVEQRYDAVVAVIRDGLTVTEAALAFGVSRQSIYRWMQRYERGGLGALADRSHRPRSCPHQLAPALEAQVLELRRHHPGWAPCVSSTSSAEKGWRTSPPTWPSTGRCCAMA